ncbi:hypothetical protein LBMAG29_10170 [Methylophilaceae bacterium]|nr:hypothetical protein LBMAG29_10170 [Methylophilaceae bacterium]
MQIKASSYSIVLAGKWNPAIITPPWILANLVDGNQQIEIEFSLSFDIPSRFKLNNITISPSVDRIILVSNDGSDESLSLIESIAIKLCNILSHTPFVAVGINFSFIETLNKDKLLPLFSFSDENKLNDNNWDISNKSIKRTLKEGVYNINLTINMDDETNFAFDLNHHYITPTSELVSAALLGKVIDYKNQSISLLNYLFDIQIEQNG